MLKLAVTLVLLVGIFAQKDQDKVTSLPGYIDFSQLFDMYSGLLKIKAEPLMNMHYIFVTSMSTTKDTDPVVVWLNGGPGCSSLLGFTQEIGPCLMQPGAKTFDTTLNPYAWNNNAHVLFLENPPGVGFSQNDDKSFEYNENNTAANAYLALVEWFKRFPEFKSKDFWITGESYCGMYIPYLANEIINRNSQAKPEDQIKLKGIMIGNGVMLTNTNWRRQARDTFYGRHQFYGPEITSMMKTCKYNDEDKTKPSCVQAEKLSDKAVLAVNPYATIGLCYGIPTAEHIISSRSHSPRRRYYYTPWFEQNNPMGSDDPPCTDDQGMYLYFNDIDVKQKLHVDSVSQNWESCNGTIGENYKKSNDSTWIFPILKTNGIKIMLYSGNTDAVVSHIETERYIQTIGWKQVGDTVVVKNGYGSMVGWRTQYEGLTYYVVNGAGHMVPTDRPYAAERIFKEFLSS